MPWRPSEPGEVPTLGFYALEWIETYLAAPSRPSYEPFVPSREQAEFTLRFYELDPVTGRRVTKRGVLSRSRGWGKSPFLSALAILEALGDVVPDGWDAAGQPVGKPWSEVITPWVVIAAATEAQTSNSWSPLLEMLAEDAPVFDEYPGLEPMGSFVNLPGRGRMIPVTTSATSIKGKPTVFTIMDQALALDTPIPTPSGWTVMGALHNGDVIYGSEGPTRVVEAKPMSVDHDCYRVTFEDATSVVASEGHIWQTKLASSAAKPRTRTTGEMFRDGRRFRIPIAPPQERSSQHLSVPPYLLGVWLGDGTRNKCELSVSEADLPALQEILLAEGVETWPRRYTPNGNQYAGSSPAVNLTFSRSRGFMAANRPEVAKALQALDCYKRKHVPAEYLAGSIEQRIGLLQGLMDSDGSCTSQGCCTFVSTLQVLADAVVDLLRSLGQVTSGAKWVADERYRGGGKWRVDFTPRGGLVPFRLPRKVERVHQHKRGSGWLTIKSITPVDRVPVRCIAVEAEDHLFAAGPGGHLTHNTETWRHSNNGIDFADVLINNAVKIGGSVIESPNAYIPGEESVAERTARAFQAMLEGRTKLDRGMYVDHREAPAETDLGDRESLVYGLRFAYGDSSDHPDGCVIHDPPCPPGWSPIEDKVERIWQLDSDEQLSRMDWLNQITHASDAWLSSPEWLGCRDESKLLQPGDLITLGFDGSRGRAKGKPDATALVGCRVPDGHIFQVGVWEADDKLTWDEWEPSIAEIEALLAEMFSRYRVAAFYADPAKDWRSYVNSWEARWGAKALVKSRPNHPFEWWMTGGRAGSVQQAVEQFEGSVRNQDLTHDGKSALTRHVLNARRRLSHGKLALGKSSDYSENKIDAAVAAVLAWQARLDAVAKGVGVQKKTATIIRAR